MRLVSVSDRLLDLKAHVGAARPPLNSTSGEAIMCGLIGFNSLRGRSGVKHLLPRLRAVSPRGLYMHTKIEEGELLGLAHLPTDDFSGAPANDFISCGQSSAFLFNGLVTNVEFLCEHFGLPAAALTSDRLCLFHGYKRHGPAFLERVRGMFAFALRRDDEVTLVRDTAGIKPLYYSFDGDLFGYCSEIKGLVKATAAAIREVALGQIIQFSIRTGELKTGSFEYRGYRAFDKGELIECLTESVVGPTRKYLLKQAEGRVAVLLSGGVDSSTILQLLAVNLEKGLRRRVVAFGLGGGASSDARVSRRFCEDLGIRFTAVTPYDERQSFGNLQRVVGQVESPLPRVVKVALLLDKLAKRIQSEGIRVSISGEGADELFYGYERFVTGLNERQIDDVNNQFFTRVFYYTLLQRLDRMLAGRQIEGRVPFLDQEVIRLSRKFSAAEKVGARGEPSLLKLPLREAAARAGVPPYITGRAKIKMTSGATGQSNDESADGYLEEFVRRSTGRTTAEYFSQLHDEEFSSRGVNRLERPADARTEQDVMALVTRYREENARGG